MGKRNPSSWIKCTIIHCSFEIYGGVLDSTDVGFLHCKSKMYLASLKGTTLLHGNKSRVKAFGFARTRKVALAA